MKKANRFISILLVFSLIFSLSVLFASAKKVYNYLVIGDSIAYGAGVLNPGEANYGRMVANTNGYNYVNLGINGLTSAGLVSMLDTDTFVTEVKKADIISISIGGNDYLTYNLLTLFINANIKNDLTVFYKIQKQLSTNIDKIVKKIKSANPGAVIFLQNVYNMRNDLLKRVNQIGSDLITECYKQYLKDHPGAYVLVDISSVLTGRHDCLAADTVHPNGKGNIEIARVVLAALKKKGFGTATEPVIKVEPVEQLSFNIFQYLRLIPYFFRKF